MWLNSCPRANAFDQAVEATNLITGGFEVQRALASVI